MPRQETEADAQLVVETKHRVPCPRCGAADSTVDHRLAAAASTGNQADFGPWYCDACGCEYVGHAHPDGRVTTRDTGGRRIKTRALLRMQDPKGPIVLEVRGFRNLDSRGEDNGHPDYLYNEHHCPPNILRDVVTLHEGDDPDSHGLFRFIEERDEPPGIDYHADLFTADDVARAGAPGDREVN